MTNGPASNRLNIVVLSEAYEASDLASKFLTDATNAINNLLSYEPYTEYSNYCNAYAISVASVQSGSSHPYYSISRNTYFKSSFDAFGYDPGIITIPPYTSDTSSADGIGKVNSLLKSLMPQSGLAILLVNDAQYGGSGGPLCVVSSADTSTFPEITVHESGHTLGGLGDEYGYGYVDIAAHGNEQPNITQATNLAAIKWDAWIPAGTPIPTEQTNQDYADVVGLFQGANYSSNGWYRPQLDCMMRTLGTPFCKICSEAMLKAIYTKARPVDSFSPTNSTVSVISTNATVFAVTPLQPATHNLSIQWFTNGIAIPGETNAVFSLFPQNFTNGTTTLKVTVHDPTPFVLNDPSNLLTTNITWKLNVNIRQMQLASSRWLLNGKFTFHLSGNAPNGFIIQASTNLTTWTSLATNQLVNGQFNYTNTALTNFNCRFYRTLVKP